jgi:ABC-type phosphate/phosphonate transport system permease subunit
MSAETTVCVSLLATFVIGVVGAGCVGLQLAEQIRVPE